MKHTHLESCPSTQIFLRENLLETNSSFVRQLVSTAKQTHGIGRSDHSWTYFSQSLAFSCTFHCSEFSVAPSLFLGVALARYLKKNGQEKVFLKWPNDLYNFELKKCGGIICHAVRQTIIVGIGLNWCPTNMDAVEDSFKPGRIFQSHQDFISADYENIPATLYQFLIEELNHQTSILEEWRNYCCHLNQSVTIQNGQQQWTGLFKGITDEGSAIIDDQIINAGSLIF